MAESSSQIHYQQMIDFLDHLDETFADYDKLVQDIALSADNEKSRIDKDHVARQEELQQIADNNKRQAKDRLNAWNRKIDNYRIQYEKIRLSIAESLSLAATYGGTEEKTVCEKDSIALLKEESKTLKARKRPDDDAPLLQKYESAKELQSILKKEISDLNDAVTQQYQKEVSHYESEHQRSVGENDSRQVKALEETQAKKIYRMQRAEENLQENVEQELQPERQQKIYDWLKATIVDCATFQPSETLPNGVDFGYARCDVDRHFKDATKANILSSKFGFAMDGDNQGHTLTMPYGHRFIDAKFSTLLLFDRASRPLMADVMRTLALQMLMSIPCNKVRFTFADPIDLGLTFACFAPLGETDSRVIDTRIWSNSNDIEQHLDMIVSHTGDVIQRCLQGRYKNIVEYNDAAGKNAEPLRIFMCMDFPQHFTSQALESMESIVSKGPQTGVFTILAMAEDDLHSDACPPSIRKMAEQMNQIICKNGRMYLDHMISGEPLEYLPLSIPTAKQMQECIKTLQHGIKESEKIDVTYDDISNNLLHHPEYWFHFDAKNGISVPIGLEGANRPVELQLGGVNENGQKRSFHAMVGGNIGSGKSTVLHAIVLGILLKYSPEDVQMYLLDFKRGVEFNNYAGKQLNNFRVIAIDTEPEFGLAVLKSLVAEEQRQSALFRQENVVRIEEYRELMAKRGVIHHNMPRLVVVFDEYQELFKDGSDPIVQECAKILKQVVLQAGSAMGIHIILSTQDIANVQGLDTALFEQFETRIVLRGSVESNQQLLSPGNPALQQLVTADIGQGVFNNAGGHQDQNRMFRGANIDRGHSGKQSQLNAWLKQISEAQNQLPDLQPVEPRLLLSSVQDDEHSVLACFVKNGEIDSYAKPENRLFVGESLTMVNIFKPTLRSRSGQNLLLVGENQLKAQKCCAFAAMSLIYETIRLEGEIDHPIITVFNFEGREEDSENNLLRRLFTALPEAFEVVDSDNLINGLEVLQSSLAQGDRHFVIFYGLNRARRLMQASNGYASMPRDLLVSLMQNGPANGMNFIVWANDAQMYQRDYNDTLPLFDYRLGFNMDTNSYQNLLGYSVRMNQNGQPDVEEGDLNAVYFDINDENRKIRLYDAPTNRWFQDFVDKCKQYIL